LSLELSVCGSQLVLCLLQFGLESQLVSDNLGVTSLVTNLSDSSGMSLQLGNELLDSANSTFALASLDLSEDGVYLLVALLDDNLSDLSGNLVCLLKGSLDLEDQDTVVSSAGNTQSESEVEDLTFSLGSTFGQNSDYLSGSSGNLQDGTFVVSVVSATVTLVVSAVLTSMTLVVSTVFATMTSVVSTVSTVLTTVSATMTSVVFTTMTLVVSTVFATMTSVVSTDLTDGLAGTSGNLASASEETSVTALAGNDDELVSTS